MDEQNKRPGRANPPDARDGRRGLSKAMAVNIVLFAGLIILYALHFAGQPQTPAGAAPEQMALIEEQVEQAGNRIAYINNQLLMEEYQLAIQLRSDFEAEQDRLEQDLNRRQRNFQSEVERFQRELSTGRIAAEEAGLKEQELMQAQQDLIRLNETYRDRLAQQEFEMNNRLLERVGDFLERYNRQKGFDFILGYARGGGILFADPSHDITAEVIDRLNREYTPGN